MAEKETVNEPKDVVEPTPEAFAQGREGRGKECRENCS